MAEPPMKVLVGALDRTRKRIKRHVADSTRKHDALATLRKFERLFEEVDLRTHQWRRDTRAAMDAGEGEDDLMAIAGQHNEHLRAVLRQGAKLAIELRAAINRGEWTLVFPEPEPEPEGKRA